jgi:hypothetical protein
MFILTGKAPVRLAWRPIPSTIRQFRERRRRSTDARPIGMATHSPANSLNSISYEGGRYGTAPFASCSRPPNGANFINQLFGASAGAAGAVRILCMW